MKLATQKLLLLAVGIILFNIIFWQEKMGVNILFFDIFIFGSVFYLYPDVYSRKTMWWLLIAHLISTAMVIVQNTELSKLTFCLTLLLLVVFTQYRHRSIWYAAVSALSNFVLLLATFMSNFKQAKAFRFSFWKIKKTVQFIIIPVFITAIFLIIYALSNAVFENFVTQFLSKAQVFLQQIFLWFKWDRLLFSILGFFIIGGLILKANNNDFSKSDLKNSDELERKKNNFRKWKESAVFDFLVVFMGRFASGILALKNENNVGVLSLILLNILLLVINVIDIIYVWFGFTYSASLNWKDFVHGGTEMLIFSILLAIGVLLFFFRGNLNFYKKNKWLRMGAYCWIFQNAILVISVLLRDYYYIQHMGLAYKRIGVLFFLLMVLMGLITLFVKINNQKTNYFLLRVNGWFAIVLLVAASCIHWDETIATYNLANKKTIPLDIPFLLSLSDKTLPIFEKNIEILEQNNPDARSGNSGVIDYKKVFEERKNNFFEAQKKYSWLSWNAADKYVNQNLNFKIGIVSAK